MADETTKQLGMTLKEAVSIIYLAQHDFRLDNDYKIFCDATRGVPWDFTDERFLAQIEELKQRLIPRLELNSEEDLKRVAEETCARTLPKDELEGMVMGLEEADAQRSVHHKNASVFAEKVVSGYIKNLKEAQRADFSPEQEAGVRSSVAQAVQLSLDTGDVSHIQKKLSSFINAPVEIPPEIQEATIKAARLTEITKTVLTSEDDTNKSVLAERCLADLETSPEVIAEKQSGELQAAKILSLSDDVKEQIDKELDNSSKRQAAFRQAAESVQQGVSRPVDDVVTAIGGPKGKEFLDYVITEVLGKSVKEIKENGTVEGAQVKTNALTAEKIRQIELSLTQREAIQKVSKSFFNEALVASAATLWGPQIQKGFMAYLETVTFKASINAPQYFHYFILAGTDVWKTIIGQSTKIAAGEAVKKVAGAFAGALLEKGAEKSVWVTLKTIIGRVIGGIPGLILTGLSVVWSGIRGLFSFLQFRGFERGIIQGFGMAAPRKKNWWEDMGLLLGIVFIIVIFVIAGLVYYIRYAFTIAQFMEERDKTNIEETQYADRGAPHGDPNEDAGWNTLVAREKNKQRKKQNPVDFCVSNSTTSLCQLTNCPTCTCPFVSSDPNAIPYITQIPGDSYTHANSNALDIKLPIQSKILSPINGVVTESVSDYEDGSGFGGSTDGGGYGNHITLTDIKGNTFIVAHLAYNSIPAKGATVTIGQQVGRIGQTGNSTGPHLHIEYTNSSAPNIGSLFPTSTAIAVGIPACGAQP